MLTCNTCGEPLPVADLEKIELTLVTCVGCRRAYKVSNSRAGLAIDPAIPPKPLPSLAQTGSVMDGILEHVDETIEKLPTIPTATQRVISAIHDPVTTSAELAQIIHEDATLSMRVMRLANSAVFSGREPITDLRVACARLGMRNIASVAHLVAHSQVYKPKNAAFGELMEQLWRHSVATARLVDMMGPVLGGLPVNVLFLSGLVHDICKPVLLEVITNRYIRRVGELKSSWNLLLRTLNEFAPYVGLMVAEHWGLAPEIRFPVFYANVPGAAPRLYRRHVYLLALASATAEATGFGIVGDADEHKTRLESLVHAFADEVSREAAERLADEAAQRVIDYVDAMAS